MINPTTYTQVQIRNGPNNIRWVNLITSNNQTALVNIPGRGNHSIPVDRLIHS